MATVKDSTPPAEFQTALASIESARLRADLVIDRIPAPTGLAPWSSPSRRTSTRRRTAPSPTSAQDASFCSTTRTSPRHGAGAFRIVCFAQAPLETEIGLDPFLAEVAWSWLTDALDQRGAQYDSASGTATKIISTGFGELARQGDGAKIELRASWTPLEADVSAHVEGWCELVCMLAGFRRQPRE